MENVKIASLLATGKDNAKTAKELLPLTGCKNIRALTKDIERARRDGIPICASCMGGKQGYYLAADSEELDRYCATLAGREHQLAKTRHALQRIAQPLLFQ